MHAWTNDTAPQAPGLTIGPLAYWWPRPEMMAFYAAVAEGPADTVVIGEVTCSRRHDWKVADWLALGRDLRSAGKQVRLATLPLLMDEAEQRVMRLLVEQDDWVVEAGDLGAVAALEAAWPLAPHRPGHVLGPQVNVYNADTLAELAQDGCRGWVLGAELPVASLPAIAAGAPELFTEVLAFGRVPLAFSARCFTARHHHLRKDDCQFRCRDDADGLLLSTSDGTPFLALNGTQTQSAALHCALGDAALLRASGAHHWRLLPCSGPFDQVVALFDAVRHGRSAPAEALAELTRLPLPGALAHGYTLGQPGCLPVPLSTREAA